MTEPIKELSGAEVQRLYDQATKELEAVAAKKGHKPSEPAKKEEKKPADSSVYTGEAKPAAPKCVGKNCELFAKTVSPEECLQEFRAAREVKAAKEPVLAFFTPVIVHEPGSPTSHDFIGRVASFEDGKYTVTIGDSRNGNYLRSVPKSWVKVDEGQVAIDTYDRERSFPGKVYDFLKPW